MTAFVNLNGSVILIVTDLFYTLQCPKVSFILSFILWFISRGIEIKNSTENWRLYWRAALSTTISRTTAREAGASQHHGAQFRTPLNWDLPPSPPLWSPYIHYDDFRTKCKGYPSTSPHSSDDKNRSSVALLLVQFIDQLAVSGFSPPSKAETSSGIYTRCLGQ